MKIDTLIEMLGSNDAKDVTIGVFFFRSWYNELNIKDFEQELKKLTEKVRRYKDKDGNTINFHTFMPKNHEYEEVLIDVPKWHIIKGTKKGYYLTHYYERSVGYKTFRLYIK